MSTEIVLNTVITVTTEAKLSTEKDRWVETLVRPTFLLRLILDCGKINLTVQYMSNNVPIFNSQDNSNTQNGYIFGFSPVTYHYPSHAYWLHMCNPRYYPVVRRVVCQLNHRIIIGVRPPCLRIQRKIFAVSEPCYSFLLLSSSLRL